MVINERLTTQQWTTHGPSKLTRIRRRGINVMRSLKKTVPAIAVVALAGLGLSACGGGDDLATPSDPTAAAGKELVSATCLGCHSVDGSRRTGPTFKGLAGSQVQLSDGSTVTADDAHLKLAITDPDAQIAKGFSKGIMSAAVPKGRYSDEEAAKMVAYIKTIK